MRKELIIGIALGFLGLGAIGFLLLQKPAGVQTTVPSQTGTILTNADVAKHSVESDCWVVVNKNVYNITNYIPNHPGGPGAIIPLCGGDATNAFNTKNGRGSHSNRASQNLETMIVGTIQ
jgi:cytochrome b involved in lipid metabolism